MKEDGTKEIRLLRPLEQYDAEACVAHFRSHGYATIPEVATRRTVELLRDRSADLMAGRVAYDGMFFQLDGQSGKYEDLVFGKGWEGPSDNYRKIEKLEVDSLFRQWIDNPLFERIARTIIEGEIVTYRAILMNKAAHGGSHLPWHQDGGSFWGIDRDPELQIWTALDDVPVEAGCVEVVPGTHLAGLTRPVGGVIRRETAVAHEAERLAIKMPAKAGDVLLLHNHVWHRSHVNTTERPRRAFSVCYMPASTRCLRKKRAPRVFPKAFASHSSVD